MVIYLFLVFIIFVLSYLCYTERKISERYKSIAKRLRNCKRNAS